MADNPTAGHVTMKDIGFLNRRNRKVYKIVIIGHFDWIYKQRHRYNHTIYRAI